MPKEKIKFLASLNTEEAACFLLSMSGFRLSGNVFHREKPYPVFSAGITGGRNSYIEPILIS